MEQQPDAKPILLALDRQPSNSLFVDPKQPRNPGSFKEFLFKV
jgi:hypothetical protein